MLVSRQSDIAVFDEMFDAFFRNPEIAQQLLSQMLPKAAKAHPVRRKARVQEALSVPRPRPADPQAGRESELKFDAAMTASDQQRLRHADFAGLSASEFRLVEQLVRQIPLPLPPVRSRRERAGTRGHRPNWSRALQQARRHEGELLQIPMMTRRPQPLPLLILVDISGSMERYARLLLAFLHQATQGTPRTAFAFGTELTDLRIAFRHRDTDTMLEMSNGAIADFAGGTRLVFLPVHGGGEARLFQRGIVGQRAGVAIGHRPKADEIARKVHAAEQPADHRHDHAVGQRRYDLAEGRADDHRHREIEHVAPIDEGLEFLEHARLPPWCV